MFDEDAKLRIRESCDCNGGKRMTKMRPKKIEGYEFGRLFFDIYQHLAKLEEEADRPRSM